nr:lysozyme inhibitor LprI family protein [Pseudaestuariivita rosea]
MLFSILFCRSLFADPPPPSPQTSQTCVQDNSGINDDPTKLRDCFLLSTRECEAEEPFVFCASRELEYWNGLMAQDLVRLMQMGAEYDQDTPYEYSFSQSVLASQTAWETYRDAQCHMVMKSMFGGSGEGPEQVRCLLETTVDRVIALRKMK